MDTAKIIDLTHLYIQKTNTLVFPIIHTSNFKRNPKQEAHGPHRSPEKTVQIN